MKQREEEEERMQKETTKATTGKGGEEEKEETDEEWGAEEDDTSGEDGGFKPCDQCRGLTTKGTTLSTTEGWIFCSITCKGQFYGAKKRAGSSEGLQGSVLEFDGLVNVVDPGLLIVGR